MISKEQYEVIIRNMDLNDDLVNVLTDLVMEYEKEHYPISELERLCKTAKNMTIDEYRQFYEKSSDPPEFPFSLLRINDDNYEYYKSYVSKMKESISEQQGVVDVLMYEIKRYEYRR